MRVAFVGGTRFVGPVAVRHVCTTGHEVAVAHSGTHEHDAVWDAEHLHGGREQLLGVGGAVERWEPDAIVDTFPGGATARKASELADCARRAGAGHLIAISSIDVYEYCVEAGMGDGSGAVPVPKEALPVREDAPLRSGPIPGGSAEHDNVSMETALQDAGKVTALRPGAIYGPHAAVREREIVAMILRGQRRLELPDGGGQLWHRVAVDRVGRAVAAALTHAPEGFWACNVVDPYDWTYAGLAGEIARLLDWEWEPVVVPFAQTDHPWQTSHPVLASDRRLREVLGVHEPDPRTALEETVNWLWEHRSTWSHDDSEVRPTGRSG